MGLGDDEAHYNDTSTLKLYFISGNSFSPPYIQTFDDFQGYNGPDYAMGNYPLESGWTNESNAYGDDQDWEVWRGETPLANTGPHNDQNTNNAVGKYLYISADKGRTLNTAILLSPCFNLSDASNPVFSFWYHMEGADMGKLYLDVFNGTMWYPNIIQPLIGNQGAGWKKMEVDLTAFIGQTISLRFRGETGNGPGSDIALDNISLLDQHAPPLAAFTANKLSSCGGNPIELKDISYNDPDSWNWEFNPAGALFVQGTDSHSPHPVVVFNQPGDYAVKLTVSNDFGQQILVKDNYIHISNGETLPVKAIFDGNNSFGNWTLANPDGDTQWALVSVTGKDDAPTLAAYMNNHSYNAPGQLDDLVSMKIDLTSSIHPLLRFDLAYAPYNLEYSDGLRVELSDDCGNDFQYVLFDKSGANLATTGFHTNGWAPANGDDWRTEVLDLSNFNGYSIVIKFTNVCGFGNNLYLDNILVYEAGTLPEADFRPNDGSICRNTPVLFYDQTTGAFPDFWEWRFGEDANPSNSYGPGPHLVTFQTSGPQTVHLITSNSLGYSVAEHTVQVGDQPFAQFSYVFTANGVSFMNQSNLAEYSFWDFGDGATSTENSPVHHYTQNGKYQVHLLVYNACGMSSNTLHVQVLDDIQQISDPSFFNITPNPATDYLLVQFASRSHPDFEAAIADSRGAIVFQSVIPAAATESLINVSTLPSGLYFIRFMASGAMVVKKVVVVK